MRRHYSRPTSLLTAFTLAVVTFALSAPAPAQTGLEYDIVYVRQPRYGDDINTVWPDTSRPAQAEPGADLMLLHTDGTEEVLVEGGIGSVTDPAISFDGRWIFYSYFYDLTEEGINQSQVNLPYLGADIFKIDVVTREIVQLTHGEFTPNTGAGYWDESEPLKVGNEFNSLDYGILNLGPFPLPGGKIAFTSSRNAFIPPNQGTAPTMQLYVMDEDGSNVTPIAPMTVGSALHPTVLQDGRIMFSTFEEQGIRQREPWGLWAVYPDGRHFEPLMSAYILGRVLHFMTQMGNGDIVVENYYGSNNNGFGVFYRFPVDPPFGTPSFHSAFLDENPDIWHTERNNDPSTFKVSFSPWGIEAITPFTHEGDNPAPKGPGGERVGKVQHPSAAPGGDLLLAWTPYAANHREPVILPYYDSGLYLQPGGAQIWDPGELMLIKNDPEYNEAWPRALVPYQAVHGVEEPVEIPWLPNDGSLHPELPAGTPHGLIGASSLYKRESFPGWVHPEQNTFDGLDSFNTDLEPQSYNWNYQGADAGKYEDSEIWAIRLLAMEPNTHRPYGPNKGKHFVNFAGERLRILGEIPVRKPDGSGGEILDPEGNPDTSFLAKIPADTPFTFQTIDRDGMVLNMAQTWHQVRPGEVRTDCGGCHAHSQQPLDFELTEAADPQYPIYDLSVETPIVTSGHEDPELAILPQGVLDVEFYRDIRPILERSCISCHTKNDPDPPGNLVLDDTTLYDGLPGDYKRLAADEEAQWGYPPVIASRQWKQNNASRYVRKFQSRRSLLIWKLFGQRLDGWTNEDHPTESVPGDAGTLPPGTDPDFADIDYTGEMMPPPGSSAPPLTHDEKMFFARWIDLGCPINSGEETGDGDFGWFLDDLKPTLTVSLPRPGLNTGEVDMLRIGMADANSGIDPATFSVKMDQSIEGRAAMDELADLFVETEPGIWVLDLASPLPPAVDQHLFAEVADVQGNIIRVDVEFTVEDPSNVYHVLSVTKTGTGEGTVVATPDGIDCGFDCEESYLEGTTVVLDPQPDEGSVFVAWSGDSDCLDSEVTMTADLTCTADFFRQPLLTVTKTGTGTGVVNSSAGGIDCGTDCEEPYDPGTVLGLGTLADPGSMFVAWSGDPDCTDGTLTMDDNRSCVAQFEIEQSLSIDFSGEGTGIVTTIPEGISCPPDCDEIYPNGEVVELTATPDADSYFLGFAGGPDCAAGTVTMDEAHLCTAWFELLPVLTVGFDGEGSGSVTSSPEGIDCGTDCVEAYADGTPVTLTATPDVGSVFATWKGAHEDCLDGVLEMNGDRDCSAKFDLEQHTVTLAPVGTGTGTIKTTPGGMNCGVNCTHDFDYGTVVTLIAEPDTESEFVAWQGDPDCLDGSLTVTAPTNCEGVFDLLPPEHFSLIMGLTGSGTGTVTSEPDGIDCGTECVMSFVEDTIVTLTATPDVGSVFASWKGKQSDCLDGVVTMNSARECFAEFELLEHAVTVGKLGTGTGTVQSTPIGIYCGATCTSDFTHGTAVTLVPTADEGSEFNGWQGHADCADGVLTVTEPMTCEATFDVVPPGNFTLTMGLIGTGSGTVTSDPFGIECGTDCVESFVEETVVTLTATPDAGSVFKSWKGQQSDCLDGVVTMSSARECYAEFELLQHTVTVGKIGTGTGTVQSSPTGIYCGANCVKDFDHGTVLTLTATPDEGSEFNGWQGHADCADGVLTVTEPMTCEASFDLLPPENYTLTMGLTGNGSGTVTSDPTGIECGTDCVESFVEETVVTLTATPDAGSVFKSWKGKQSDCLDGVVTMNGPRECFAEFELLEHTVTVSKLGTGTGTVQSTPTGIYCGNNCAKDFDDGTTLTLTATPDEGSEFNGWQGHADCADGVLTVTEPMTCEATFELLPPENYTLTMGLTGNGSGTVTSDPIGIDCGTDCTESFVEETIVTLTATPDAGSVFKSWKGKQSDCLDGVVTMNGPRECFAEFELLPVLSVATTGTGTGTVTSSPTGIDCGTDCEESFPEGTVITLSPTPDPGSLFAGWSGPSDCADNTVTLSNDMTCTAVFVKRNLSVALVGTGTGTVISVPTGINCPTDCSEDYDDGTVVALTPTPDPDSLFATWTGDPDCSDGIVTMDSDIVCKAKFKLPQLNVAKTGTGSGTVTSSPAGIDCGSDCSEEFPVGSVVVLTATPDAGSAFVGWTGDPDCLDGSVVLSADMTCKARFDPD